MAIEVNSSGGAICRRCGTAHGRLKGYFPVSYGPMYKGVGYLPYCRTCVDEMYSAYLSECKEPRYAVRQMCRKLDLYWNESIFENVEKQNAPRSMMTQYLSKIASVKNAGKCYDDTLREEGTIWDEPKSYASVQRPVDIDSFSDEGIEISDDVKAMWGPGYTPAMYMELEQRKNYWISRLPAGVEFDIGTEAIIKQVCCLEIDINRDRACGKPVDRSISTLNALLNNTFLKPAQKKDDVDAELEKMPLGVGIQKWELSRPLPEAPKEFRDVRGSIKNISIWYLGHACKMVGLKNSYSKLYEDAMEELRVKRPEIEEEDDNDFLSDLFGNNEAGG